MFLLPAGLNVYEGVTVNRTKMIFTTRGKISIFSISIFGLITFLMYASYQVKFGQEINQPTHSNSRMGKSTSWKWFTALDAHPMNYAVKI